ncbi:MAG: HAMP domain-containing sensor histidine kinase [Anaerolineales bacterium]|nr:HAMP domain-containing sensor histidine kinase [Anaerolineales bacterium]
MTRRLARGEELRTNLAQILEQFYNALIQAVETGDPAWLDPILNEWVKAYTETEISSHELSLLAILGQLHLTTLDVAREILTEADALSLLSLAAPAFVYAFQTAARLEMERTIERISWDLEKANASLQRLDKSKSNFISVAAHELKTPLTLIEGYAAMLRDQLPASAEFEQARIILKGVNNGTRRLREIIDDMIDVSLIDNQLLSLNFQPVWINRLIDLLHKDLARSLEERQQILEIYPFDGWAEMTFGDSERLYQAFRNVLLNSIKYTPDGGKISISGRQLPGFVEIIIADTGIGIDPEDHLRIFDKFGNLGDVSLHSSGKTKYKGGGPGLGLSITKGIIEAHGGSIWVESPGYDEIKCPGSTFHILLPLRKTPPDDRTAKLFAPLYDTENFSGGSG